MKKTAVHWLEDIILNMEQHGADLPPLMIHIQKAKEMEKEQMIKFAFDVYYDISNKMKIPFNLISENRLHAETYYNETYKQD
jgi:hypothetical protein